MKTLFNLSRTLGLLLAIGSVSLTACKKESDDSAAATGDGTVTWTHNGTTYTDTFSAGAVVDPGDKLFIIAASKDRNNALSIPLLGISAKGTGVYDLPRGSALNDCSVGSITLNGTTPQGVIYSTLYGPNASNGTVTVTEYDKNAQKISGTFSFTAGAMPNSGATGTQTVTNGSFSIHRFR
ncbi:Riean_0653 family protein [Hymenobacter daeguensis]